MHRLQQGFLAIGLLAALTAHAGDSNLSIRGIANACNTCHGTDGVSAGASIPSIGGLPEAYLKNVMMQWKSGERASANMTRLIKGYTDEEIAALARHFSSLPWKPQVQAASADLVRQGRGVTERCEDCHGATGSEPDDADTPRLNGQWSQYMALELMKYRDESFKMTHTKMIKNARKLEAGDVETAARFFGAQSK